MFNLTPWRRDHPERGEFTRVNAHPLARFRDEMDALLDPERLARLDLAGLDG